MEYGTLIHWSSELKCFYDYHSSGVELNSKEYNYDRTGVSIATMPLDSEIGWLWHANFFFAYCISGGAADGLLSRVCELKETNNRRWWEALIGMSVGLTPVEEDKARIQNTCAYAAGGTERGLHSILRDTLAATVLRIRVQIRVLTTDARKRVERNGVMAQTRPLSQTRVSKGEKL